jgi:hypothetical protein
MAAAVRYAKTVKNEIAQRKKGRAEVKRHEMMQ